MASTKRVVHLGFALELLPNELFSLSRQFLPLGKVGGHPSWLNPANLPSTEELSCGVCSKPLAFLLQVYCTNPQSPSHAFHRTIFMFVCRDVECSRTNDAANFVVVRGQLPRQNGYYSAERALAPEVGDVSDPYYNETTFARLCRLCGCRATKKCAKCAQQWYCSKEHQVIDWTAGGHKLQCGSIEPNSLNINNKSKEAASSVNPFLFKEFGIEIDVEEGDKGEDDNDRMDHNGGGPDDDDDEEDSDDNDHEAAESNRALAERLKELKKFENADISEKDLEGIEERAKDVFYKAFRRRISANPTQILRYEKGGIPLLATDRSPRPLTAADLTARCSGGDGAVECRPIPNCVLCGAPRQFEFQLMPHLLSLIEVDQLGKSIDWATLMIFTCSRDCPIPNDGYAREFVFKQDFVDLDEEMLPQEK